MTEEHVIFDYGVSHSTDRVHSLYPAVVMVRKYRGRLKPLNPIAKIIAGWANRHDNLIPAEWVKDIKLLGFAVEYDD